MKIIVASFPKTGTKSLNAALTILGYRVYDFLEHAYYHNKEWLEILSKGCREQTVEMFRKMYKDIDVVLDLPACYFWEEILEAFPEAKIVLTLRAKEDYYRSAQKQVEEINADWRYRLMNTVTPTGRKISSVVTQALPVVFGFKPDYRWSKIFVNETVQKLRFRQHTSHVLKHAPPEKLLVFHLKDGWGPLCDFLGLEEPNTEFPRKNRNGTAIAEFRKENKIMMQMVKEFKVLTYISLVTVLLFFLFLM
uniref:Uncharacterized protein LOC100178838 n=1 Tax=Phallusia mammillata TaxID=59560 RepID=A0A6F9DHT1_9ASCI|nr:uncharacterized protein LOC100178838 [Phallusia mammillata]